MTVYYTNARLNGKTALLAGPFSTVELAERCIDICGPMFIAREPAAAGATFGVLSVSRSTGLGLFNPELRANGIPAPIVEN